MKLLLKTMNRHVNKSLPTSDNKINIVESNTFPSICLNTWARLFAWMRFPGIVWCHFAWRSLWYFISLLSLQQGERNSLLHNNAGKKWELKRCQRTPCGFNFSSSLSRTSRNNNAHHNSFICNKFRNWQRSVTLHLNKNSHAYGAKLIF